MKVTVLSLNEDTVKFIVDGIDTAFANALRRTMVSEVPTMAVEDIFYYDNTSVVPDEVLAHRIGLVHKVISQAEFSEFVERFAASLAEKSPVAVRLALDAINHGKNLLLRDGLAYEARLSEECLKSEDSKEGRIAFAEKRKPNFKGR